jgi:hypothetical protein
MDDEGGYDGKFTILANKEECAVFVLAVIIISFPACSIPDPRPMCKMRIYLYKPDDNIQPLI